MKTTMILFAMMAIVIMIFAGCAPAQEQPNLPDPNAEKIYVSEDPEQCKLIKFMCVENREPFFDDKGCGCKLKTTDMPIPEPQKVFCAAYQREAGPCTKEYMPVCGFDGDDAQIETYGNSCMACNVEGVAYFLPGECKSSEPERHYCTDDERLGDACTMEYNPVCGYYDPQKIVCVKSPCAQTFGNDCGACHDENVEYLESGECPA